MPEKTFYHWKGRFGGMDVSEAKWHRAMEKEKVELKKLVANLSLDNGALKAVPGTHS